MKGHLVRTSRMYFFDNINLAVGRPALIGSRPAFRKGILQRSEELSYQ